MARRSVAPSSRSVILEYFTVVGFNPDASLKLTPIINLFVSLNAFTLQNITLKLKL